MKKINLIILLLVLSTFSFAQEIRTLTSIDSVKTFGGYGGPLIETTKIINDWGVLFGGKGGFIMNRKIAFGGIGTAMVNNPVFMGNSLSESTEAPLQLEYASGGVFFEYFFNLERPVHFSIPVNIMGGGITVNEENTNNEIESSGMFVIQPGINMEFNMTKHFIPTVYVTYRQVLASSLVNFDNRDLSGISVGILLKFGTF